MRFSLPPRHATPIAMREAALSVSTSCSKLHSCLTCLHCGQQGHIFLSRFAQQAKNIRVFHEGITPRGRSYVHQPEVEVYMCSLLATIDKSICLLGSRRSSSMSIHV